MALGVISLDTAMGNQTVVHGSASGFTNKTARVSKSLILTSLY